MEMATIDAGNTLPACYCRGLARRISRDYSGITGGMSVNANRLDLNLLRVFGALLETRSVTIAASTLGLTQSAVSNQLARLRDAFDDPLFVRTSEGMVPTPRAL